MTVLLRFRTYESRRHGGHPLYEWLLAQGRELELRSGHAFRAMSGFGRDGRMHEQRFFELAGEEPVIVEFVADAAQADALLARVDAAGLGLPYLRVPVESGITAAG